LSAAIASGALNGIPIVGLFTKATQAVLDISQSLFVRKIAIFLREFSQTSAAEREAFVSQFSSDESQFEFGQTLLLLLDRAEDVSKPAIVGRLFASAARGHLTLEEATRVSKMVDRAYSEDFSLLLDFCPGVQGLNSDRAASLSAAGFLTFAGLDEGEVGDPFSGGVIYDMSHFGRILVTHGLRTAT
jgi:hypothetical protein